jgi:hypothetical protein
MPQVVVMAKQKNYFLTISALVELAILAALSWWWGRAWTARYRLGGGGVICGGADNPTFLYLEMAGHFAEKIHPRSVLFRLEYHFVRRFLAEPANLKNNHLYLFRR